jgi:hypothetical protein
VRFTVAGKGGRIAGFRADAPTVCSSTTSPTGAEPGSGAAERPLVELAPDGDFGVDGTHTPITLRFSGRAKGRRRTGARAVIRTSSCAGSVAMEARRR